MKPVEQKSERIGVIASGTGWLAVDKPAGMSVHNEPGNDLWSLAAELIRKSKALQERVGVSGKSGVDPVHRLDRETGGLILLAARRETLRYFAELFESREVQKRYIALLHGRPEEPAEDNPWGTWDWPLTSTAAGRADPQGIGKLQESRTLYRVMGRSIHYTLVELELLTGRTHQIRRHAKLAGCPVTGDIRYGSTRAANFLLRNHGFQRLGLHSQSLTLVPPDEEEPTTLETAGIPAEMLKLFEGDSPE